VNDVCRFCGEKVKLSMEHLSWGGSLWRHEGGRLWCRGVHQGVDSDAMAKPCEGAAVIQGERP